MCPNVFTFSLLTTTYFCVFYLVFHVTGQQKPQNDEEERKEYTVFKCIY